LEQAAVPNLSAMTHQYRAVLSPCIGICHIADDGLCAGCHRTGAEIALWPGMNDDCRLRMMDEVLPQRAAMRVDP
jgi:predicted Fe-S protein YdhL (DUF1289 family)